MNLNQEYQLNDIRNFNQKFDCENISRNYFIVTVYIHPVDLLSPGACTRQFIDNFCIA